MTELLIFFLKRLSFFHIKYPYIKYKESTSLCPPSV